MKNQMACPFVKSQTWAWHERSMYVSKCQTSHWWFLARRKDHCDRIRNRTLKEDRLSASLFRQKSTANITAGPRGTVFWYVLAVSIKGIFSQPFQSICLQLQRGAFCCTVTVWIPWFSGPFLSSNTYLKYSHWQVFLLDGGFFKNDELK